MLSAEVDLVAGAVETETDRLIGDGAINIVFEDYLHALGHEAIVTPRTGCPSRAARVGWAILR